MNPVKNFKSYSRIHDFKNPNLGIVGKARQNTCIKKNVRGPQQNEMNDCKKH